MRYNLEPGYALAKSKDFARYTKPNEDLQSISSSKVQKSLYAHKKYISHAKTVDRALVNKKLKESYSDSGPKLQHSNSKIDSLENIPQKEYLKQVDLVLDELEISGMNTKSHKATKNVQNVQSDS